MPRVTGTPGASVYWATLGAPGGLLTRKTQPGPGAPTLSSAPTPSSRKGRQSGLERQATPPQTGWFPSVAHLHGQPQAGGRAQEPGLAGGRGHGCWPGPLFTWGHFLTEPQVAWIGQGQLTITQPLTRARHNTLGQLCVHLKIGSSVWFFVFVF